jgi:hypothetical protein
VSGLDVSALSPSDAAVALRSYPRRFRAALTRADPDEEVPAEAVEHAADAARVLGLVRNALVKVTASEGAVIPAGVLDETQREFTMPADWGLERALDVLDEEATALAAQIDRVAAGDWHRTGSVTGGGTASALDLVREAVRAGHGHLRAAEAAARRR